MFVCGRGLFIAGILNPVDVEAGPVGFENEAEEDVDVEVVADVVDKEEDEKLLLLLLSSPLNVCLAASIFSLDTLILLPPPVLNPAKPEDLVVVEDGVSLAANKLNFFLA